MQLLGQRSIERISRLKSCTVYLAGTCAGVSKA